MKKAKVVMWRERQPDHYGESWCMEVTFNRRKQEVFLGAGLGDEIHVWKDKDGVYVVSMNYGLPYVGMEVFSEGNEGELGLAHEVFLQGSEQVEECLGKKGLLHSPAYIRKVLSNHCY